MKIPKSHPRYESIRERHLLVEGLNEGYLAPAGLIAHGRGEAFDYFIGEKTLKEALKAEKAAVALMLLSKKPIISVNGNTAALVPMGIVRLASVLGAGIEVNLFYRTLERERLIRDILKKNGAKKVYGVGSGAGKRIPGLDSERGKVDERGIWSSDTVLVTLEDGDRAEALVSMKKNVISIDLNPLSRTTKAATVSVVDNVLRAVPNMINLAREMKGFDERKLRSIYCGFDNKGNLARIERIMRQGIR